MLIRTQDDVILGESCNWAMLVWGWYVHRFTFIQPTCLACAIVLSFILAYRHAECIVYIYTHTKLSTIWNALEYHVYYLPPSCTTSSSVSCHKTESWLHHQLTRTAALLRCRRGSLHCGIYHSLCSFVLLANQPAVFFSYTKSASVTSQTIVLFSHNKWAPAIAKRTECAFTINFWGLCFSISSMGLFASKLSDTYPNLDIKMLLYFLFAIYVYCVRVVFLYDYELSVAIWN